MKTLKKSLKIFIALPIMAIVELLCFLACSLVSLVDHARAKRMIDWVCGRLPNRDWYFI